MNVGLRPLRACGIFLVLSCLLNAVACAAEVEKKQVGQPGQKPPKIADEPQTVDPAKLVSPQLAVPVTVTFDESSLREISQWIETHAKITVLIDTNALEEEAIPLGEAVSDRLEKAPLYLFLNRLRALNLSWYVEDDILKITTVTQAMDRFVTKPYRLADLLDAGYKRADLSGIIPRMTSGAWRNVDGAGGAQQSLGDVQFVRQTHRVHREIAGLLAALRKHGRQTFTLDPPQHIALRQKLQEKMDINFREVPLFRAVQKLAQQSGTDIRLDLNALRDQGIRERQPVSLVLADRKLNTILPVLLRNLRLTWILRDGVMWITTEESAARQQKTAIYDVRDLCRNKRESAALANAIINQTKGPWQDTDGVGGIILFAKNGTMVVRQTENVLLEVLVLLETYRNALRDSKPRNEDAVDPDEVVMRYYRMPATIARDLLTTLPQLVVPGSWKTEQNPNAPGQVRKVASRSQILNSEGWTTIHMDATGGNQPHHAGLVVPHDVLIIHQTRKVHERIALTIQRIEQGDPPAEDPAEAGTMGGAAFGGGGFGGGFFRVP